VSSFERTIRIQPAFTSPTTEFGGEQLSSYSELNYNLNKGKHNLNLGTNITTEDFTETPLDTSIVLRDQRYRTAGVYVNHLWDAFSKFSLESGLRADYAMARSKLSQNPGEYFILPRISGLFKASQHWSFRLGGGMGYRMPTIFNEDSEPYGFKNISPIDFSAVEAERSYGGNFDAKYQSTFGSDNVLFTFNHMFFYNVIDNPILLQIDTTGVLRYTNAGKLLHSRGFETQVKLTVWKFTWFIGYTYTDAFLERADDISYLTLTPIHSIKGDLLFVEDNKWRIGWDYEYKSGQLISNGTRTRDLFTTGIVVERTIDNFVIFLNAENFTDVRQTRYESLESDPFNTPQFTDVWAPLDGFFFNGGLKIKL
jgi:iron complex outermembrane receptor protein